MTDGIRVLAPPPIGRRDDPVQGGAGFPREAAPAVRTDPTGALEAPRGAAERVRRWALPAFLPGTASVRKEDWKVGPTPADLEKRWVEILDGLVEKAEFTEFLTLPA